MGKVSGNAGFVARIKSGSGESRFHCNAAFQRARLFAISCNNAKALLAFFEFFM